MSITTPLSFDKLLFREFKNYSILVFKQANGMPFFDGKFFSLVDDFCNENLMPDSNKEHLKSILLFYKPYLGPKKPPEVEEFWFDYNVEKIKFLRQIDTELTNNVDNERVIEIVKRIITYVNLQDSYQSGICKILKNLYDRDNFATQKECGVVYERLFDYFKYSGEYTEHSKVFLTNKFSMYWFPKYGSEASSLRVKFLNDYIKFIS